MVLRGDPATESVGWKSSFTGVCRAARRGPTNFAERTSNGNTHNDLRDQNGTVAYRLLLADDLLSCATPISSVMSGIKDYQLADNHLLAAISEADRALLAPTAELVEVARRDLLIVAERPFANVYFIVDGIASVLSVMADGTGVETATVGKEGMIGLAAFHGVDVETEQTMMQVPGFAFRMPVSDFISFVRNAPTLNAMLHRYSAYVFSFAAQNSGCNRKHPVEARCARWVLTVSDRLERPEMELTHDFVSQMLGVRRATVTETLGSFEDRGWIRAARGRITIVDRSGMEGVVCECYPILRGAYERLFKGRGVRSPLSKIPQGEGEKSTLGEPHG
jgi:CRP-like cAMP-binding protein